MALTKASAGVINTSELVGYRNRIINGGMSIHQRGNTINYLTTAGGGKYAVDRFNSTVSANTSNVSVEQSTTVPDGEAFTNSIKYTVVTSATMSGNDLIVFQQRVEKNNTNDLNYGTSYAKTTTLSFWVRSSVTGTYSAGIKDTAGDRYYWKTYTINQANTWEYKTLTIPGDTSGAWALPRVVFSLGIGTTYRASPNTWGGSLDAWGTSSDTNTWTQTVGNTFYITGVQWEKGSAATPFEFRHYSHELALCQRYYYKFVSGGAPSLFTTAISPDASAGILFYLRTPVPMRVSPSCSTSDANTFGTWPSVSGGSTILGSSFYSVGGISSYPFQDIEFMMTLASSPSTQVSRFGFRSASGFIEAQAEL